MCWYSHHKFMAYRPQTYDSTEHFPKAAIHIDSVSKPNSK